MSCSTQIIIPDFLNLSSLSNSSYKLQVHSNLDVKIGFDMITCSFWSGYRFELFTYLKHSDFICREDVKLEKGMYSRYRLYEQGPQQIEILYKTKANIHDFHVNRYLIRLHSPTQSIITCLNDFLYDRYPLQLSQVEIAFDFYCEKDLMRHLRSYLESMIFLKYNRRPSFRYYNHEDGSNTFYAADRKCGRSAKALKCYEKGENGGEDFLRMEITLTRGILANNGVRCLSDLPGIWNLDLSRMLAFRHIDYSKLSQYLGKQRSHRMVKRYRELNKRVNLQRLGIIHAAAKNISGHWVRSCVEPYSDGFDFIRIALLEQIDVLKRNHVKYSRFLVPVEDEFFSYLQFVFRQNYLFWSNSLNDLGKKEK